MNLGLRVAASLSFCLALTTLQTSSAHAFCRTNSCDPSRGETCSLDSTGCRKGGVDLYWTSASVKFLVQKDGSVRNSIDAPTFEQVIANAFDSWMNADCGMGNKPTITVSSGGFVESSLVEYQKGNAANIYMFRDDEWLASGPASALALTTVWYNWRNGKIYDADTEVNGTLGSTNPEDPNYGGRITIGEPEDGADLPSIITHEAGHFLGLDHSPFHPEATMFTTYDPGSGNLRVLSEDDVAGICAVYPQDRFPADGGCSCAVPSNTSTKASWFGLALGVCALFLTRRARRLVASARRRGD
jgi:hypothetical protein